MTRRWRDEEIATIFQAAKDGKPQRAIALEFGVTRASIRSLLERTRFDYGKWTEDKIAEARRLADSGWKLGQLAVHFGVSYNAIQKALRRSVVGSKCYVPPVDDEPKPRGWAIGSGRGQHPLADPLLAALFEHHRDRAPESLVRRSVPATTYLPTRLPRPPRAQRRRAAPRSTAIIMPAPSTLEDGRPTYPSLRSVLNRVLAAHEISEVEFRSGGRTARCAQARQHFFYLAALETVKSLPQIGQFVDRDHSTILHGIRVYCARNNLRPPRGHALNRAMRRNVPADIDRAAAEARACA